MQNKLEKVNQQLSKDAIDNLAVRSMGMSLADISSVIDSALREMLRNGADSLDDSALNEAFEAYCFGEKEIWSKEAIYRVAIHEAGHALIDYVCGNKPAYITVTSRENVGGYVHRASSELPFQTKKQLLDNIRVALAGRAAEMIFFGDEEGLTTGAANDLRVATNIAVSMATTYGMSDEHPILVQEQNQLSREETVEYCNVILKNQLEEATAIILENKDKLIRLVDELIDKNCLMEKQIDAILR